MNCFSPIFGRTWGRSSVRVFAGVFLFLSVIIALPATADAAGPVEAAVTNVRNGFPDEIIFDLTASSTAGDLKTITMRFKVGVSEAERYGTVTLTPGGTFQGEYKFKTNHDNFLPAGTDIEYWTEVEDTVGNMLSTDRKRFWYADTRFQWKKVLEGPTSIYHYGNTDIVAQSVARAARETQGKIGDMLGVAWRPYTVMLYNSVPEIIGAQRPEPSETRRRELFAAGTHYPGTDLVQVLGVGTSFASDTARHEIAHLYVAWAGGSSVPTWLNEGLAVWAQTDPGNEYRNALQRAIATNDLLLIRGMESFGGSSEDTLLAYGQSWSVVNYMITTYGPDKFRQLFESIRAGNGARQALQDIYGMDIDKLDAAWRASVGAPPRSYETLVPTAIAIPTFAPIGAIPAPQPGGGTAGQAATPAGSVLVIGAGVFGLVFVLLLAGVAAVFVKRRAA